MSGAFSLFAALALVPQPRQVTELSGTTTIQAVVVRSIRVLQSE